MANHAEERAGIRPWQHIAVFFIAFAVIVSRRPDAILNAQFWNEDGHVFFADAYNFGWWATLFRIYEGYVHLLPRLGADLALLVPLSFAPLVLNLIAIGFQILPVNLLLSPRSSTWGSLRFRALLAGMYLALPNCFEVNANITGSQWLLALSAFLLLVASPPLSIRGQVSDLCVISICGLTGPLCIFLFPVAAFLAWRHRDSWRSIQSAILATACLVQAWSLSHGGLASRPHDPLGASPETFARILAGQVYLGTLLGGWRFPAHADPWSLVVIIGICVGGTIFVAACFPSLPLAMKLFLHFSTVLLAACLISPTAGTLVNVTPWEVLARGSGARYYLLPTLALAWAILSSTRSRNRALKSVSFILVCVLCVGIPYRWRHFPYPDAHYAEYAARVEAASPGTAITIPQCTPGWNLTLVKH
jgi:hypothetical protein